MGVRNDEALTTEKAPEPGASKRYELRLKPETIARLGVLSSLKEVSPSRYIEDVLAEQYRAATPDLAALAG